MYLLCPNVSSMIRYRAVTVEALADKLGQALNDTRLDPFKEDLVLTRTSVLHRWLATRLGLILGASGHQDGVCSRVRFLSMGQFATFLQGSSPWSVDSLTQQILIALNRLPDDVVFTQIRTHLADQETRPRRRIGFAHQIASRFATYATWNQDMTNHWQKGEYVSAEGIMLSTQQLWQPYLWNLVTQQIGVTPDQNIEVLTTLAKSRALQYAHICLFCIDTLSPTDQALITALDCANPITVFSQDHQPVAYARHIAGKLSAQQITTNEALDGLCLSSLSEQVLADPGWKPILLHSVQQSLAANRIVPVGLDDSIQIHAVPEDGQVEFLSDLLVTLLDRDPNLEPRDVLVLVHKMETYYEPLKAFLHPDDSVDSSPRHRIRAAISSTQPPQGTVIEVLFLLMDLVHGRATAEELHRLCCFPPVMNRFGFQVLDPDKLASLIAASGIRWGLNPAHRASFGMDGFAQNTWMAGLGRMVLGVALSEDDLTYQRTVLPLDAVDSDTVRLVEALGQIITHIRDCCQTWPVLASASEWADRFRTSLDWLTGDGWRASPIVRVITSFENDSKDKLSLAEASALLRRIWNSFGPSPSVFNGDLTIAPIGTTSVVPYKVIILFGLDDSFPQLPIPDGDNLSGQNQPELEARVQDRQVFYDALISARQQFIAIYSGYDPTSPDATPRPTPIVDLLKLCQDCVDSPGSLEGLVKIHSTATQSPSAPTNERSSTGQPPTGDRGIMSNQVEIDDVSDLFINPAGYWLKRNAGLAGSVLKPEDRLPSEMAVTMSGLEAWQVTDRMVRLLLAGKSEDAIVQAELRRGSLPPGGSALANEYLRRAQDIVRRARSVMVEPTSWQPISLPQVGGKELNGQIGVHGDTVVDLLAGRVQPRHQISAWIRLLCLSVAYPDQVWRAVLVGNHLSIRLTAAPPDEAGRYLEYLFRVYESGLISPLPLPTSTSALLARYLVRDLAYDSSIDTRGKIEWERDPVWSVIWPTWQDMISQKTQANEALPDREFESRFLTLAYGIYVPLIRAGGVS